MWLLEMMDVREVADPILRHALHNSSNPTALTPTIEAAEVPNVGEVANYRILHQTCILYVRYVVEMGTLPSNATIGLIMPTKAPLPTL